LRDQRAEVLGLSSPLVSTLFNCTQSFDFAAQQVAFDEQQLEFSPHDRQRIGSVPGLGSRKWGCQMRSVRSSELRRHVRKHAQSWFIDG
jgi:hypothetical protein